MDFKKTLPPLLYEQSTNLHPHRFHRPGKPGADEVKVDRRWSLSLDASCGRLTRLAADDLRHLMRTSFGQSLTASRTDAESSAMTVRVRPAGRKPEAYVVDITSQAVTIDAEDDEAGMRALFHLGQAMLNRRGPFLALGKQQRAPQWAMRITSPLLHRSFDRPEDYLDLPENYLLNMARYGYNATYLYMDWFDFISPGVGGPLARPGWRKRINTLEKAAQYLARFGIRLLFHINTLALTKDHRQFKASPPTRGAQTWEVGRHCLCSSSPAVLKFYHRAAAELFTGAPTLAGAVLLTGGECFLHCYTRPTPRIAGSTNCARCRKRPPEQVIARVVNAFAEGVRETSPAAQVLMWPYSAFSWGDLEAQKRLIEKLHPQNIATLVVFEKDDWLTIDDTRSYVFDYSISQVGPSPRFRSLDRTARHHKLRRFAKTETSIAIELFNVPRIPVMHQWAKRLAALRRQNLDGLHTTWRFYGFAAQRTDELLDYYNWQSEPDAEAFLTTMAARDFGPNAAPRVVKAWQILSDAFALFPYCGGITGFPYFRGPMYIGSAHPFVFDLTSSLRLSEKFWNIDPTREEISTDQADIERSRQPLFFMDATWTQPFGLQTMSKRLAKMTSAWAVGVDELAAAGAGLRGGQRRSWQHEYDVARVIGCIFHTAAHLARFQLLREAVTTRACAPDQLQQTCTQATELLRDELANAQTAIELVQRDSRLGYGATYGTAFDAAMIQEKIEHTHHQIDHAIPRFLSNYSFHIFGQPH